ncbi:MAG: diaminopimelate epimerase [Candidatus Margulisbacteria bacterium GWF2_35_9]|nr:MAG: diaminopimelate epimerase [Candidatus Margulisbacteria bacterium GWF2_35_9]
MNFTKMHGTGNDFILVNCMNEDISKTNWPEISTRLCDRHFGIGADGLILVLPSNKYDLQMRIFNADGSEAEMCGNGIRCFTLFAKEQKLINKNTTTIETLAGKIVPEIITSDGDSATIKINMGQPQFNPDELTQTINILYPSNNGNQTIVDRQYTVTPVNMGNPHAVIFVGNTHDFPVTDIGPIIEADSFFPNKTNVEFIEIISENEIKMRVWERGSGETLACGTGACASVVAGILHNKLADKVTVNLLGGKLEIDWPNHEEVYLTGSAKIVFNGQITI